MARLTTYLLETNGRNSVIMCVERIDGSACVEAEQINVVVPTGQCIAFIRTCNWR